MPAKHWIDLQQKTCLLHSSIQCLSGVTIFDACRSQNIYSWKMCLNRKGWYWWNALIDAFHISESCLLDELCSPTVKPVVFSLKRFMRVSECSNIQQSFVLSHKLDLCVRASCLYPRICFLCPLCAYYTIKVCVRVRQVCVCVRVLLLLQALGSLSCSTQHVCLLRRARALSRLATQRHCLSLRC